MTDFVAIVEQLAGFIQNERTSSYNEGVDMILENARTWMSANGMYPKAGEHIGICDLLNQISDHYRHPVGAGQQRGADGDK